MRISDWSSDVCSSDLQSSAVDVKFAAADVADLAKRFGVADASGAAFVIWTTTPWTLPANQAVAANAELDYALVDFARAGRVVIARSEEHTSELQSLMRISYAVFCLKKKNR